MRNTRYWINILWVLVVLLAVARLASTAFAPSLTIPVVMAAAVFALIHGAVRNRWSGCWNTEHHRGGGYGQHLHDDFCVRFVERENAPGVSRRSAHISCGTNRDRCLGTSTYRRRKL